MDENNSGVSANNEKTTLDTIGEKLTGRSSNSAYVYANPELVKKVDNDLEGIQTSLGNASEGNIKLIDDDFNALSSVKGVSDYYNVDSIKTSYIDTLTGIANEIGNIRNTIDESYQAIVEFTNADPNLKVGSSILMGLAKLGEGGLSVLEDLGDGIVSVAGWIAPRDSDFENACASFIENNWSHDAFNFYYNSDLAKASLFTEDSMISGGFKLVGKTAGYLYTGGVLSGVGGALGLGNLSPALSVASGSTWGATLAAGIGGMGSGTEAGLKSGKDINEAAYKNGLKSATIQAGLAFAGGKIGENLSKSAAIKEAEKTLKTASDNLDMASADIEDGITSLASGEYDAAARELSSAQKSLELLKGSKASNYEGYTDIFTKAGQKTVSVPINAAKSGINALKTGGDAVSTTATASTTTDGGASLIKQDGHYVVSSSSSNPGQLLSENTASQAAKTVKDTLTTSGKNAASIPGTIGTGARVVTSSIASPKPNNDIKLPTPKIEQKDTTPSYGSSNNIEMSTPASPSTTDSGSSSNSESSQSSSGKSGGGSSGGGGNSGGGGSSYSPSRYTSTDYTPTKYTPSTSTPSTVTDNIGTSKPINNNNNNNISTPTNSTSNSLNNGINQKNTTTTPTSYEKLTPNENSNSTINQTTPFERLSTNETIGQPSGISASTETFTGSTTSHYTGGSYNDETGFISANEENGLEEMSNIDLETTLKDNASNSIEDIIKNGRYVNIPTSSVPIQPTSMSKGNSVIPVTAGLSAAAAAGIGAKAYIDNKNNNYDEIDTEEWNEDDNLLEIDENEDKEQSSEDEYDYEEETEKYGARNNEEILDLQ